jgi:imidazoleglycerol phosphate synthase glutamine amidotransferase subunit HisH
MKVQIEESLANALVSTCGTLTARNITILWTNTSLLVDLISKLSDDADASILISAFSSNLEAARNCKEQLYKLLSAGFNSIGASSQLNEMISILDMIEKQLYFIHSYCSGSSSQDDIHNYFKCREAAATKIREMENW